MKFCGKIARFTFDTTPAEPFLLRIWQPLFPKSNVTMNFEFVGKLILRF